MRQVTTHHIHTKTDLVKVMIVHIQRMVGWEKAKGLVRWMGRWYLGQGRTQKSETGSEGVVRSRELMVKDLEQAMVLRLVKEIALLLERAAMLCRLMGKGLQKALAEWMER